MGQFRARVKQQEAESPVLPRFTVDCSALPFKSHGVTIPHNQEGSMGEALGGTPASNKPLEDRLDSWKEIAAYLDRDITTVQRWEKREGMPVHRHLHDKMGSVYAYRTELDAWAHSRAPRSAEEEEFGTPVAAPPAATSSITATASTKRWRVLSLAAAAIALAIAGGFWIHAKE